MKQNLYTYSTWNEVLKHRHRKSKAKRLARKAKAAVVGIATTVGVVAMIGITGITDYDAECIRREKGTYYNGYILSTDGNVWGYESDDLTDNEIVDITFYTNGTDDNLTDDEIVSVNSLGEYETGQDQITAIHETEFGCLIEFADNTGYYCEY